MIYCDYTWDLHAWGIKFDEEIDAEKLAQNHGWKEGDYFKLVKRNGVMTLVKLDPVEQFFKGYKVNCNE